MAGQEWPIILGVGVVVWWLALPHSSLCPVYWTYFDKILLTIQNVSPILFIEHLFAIGCYGRGRVL